MMRLPSSTLVPARRTTTGWCEADFLVGFHDALGDPVAAVDAREDVDEDDGDVAVGQHGAEGADDAFGRLRRRRCRGSWRGSPPASLIMSIVAMARPAPLMMQPMSP